mmetsp:Transcript_15758/g.47815  ORF Transcript_15758/g.47815 Transcript_15758/m.47815 type:complete len:130 (-) Transcript_15758:515-904(-)|eukprot:scaffold81336_cov29-Tisochrysis_lutea.AAC.1
MLERNISFWWDEARAYDSRRTFDDGSTMFLSVGGSPASNVPLLSTRCASFDVPVAMLFADKHGYTMMCLPNQSASHFDPHASFKFLALSSPRCSSAHRSESNWSRIHDPRPELIRFTDTEHLLVTNAKS